MAYARDDRRDLAHRVRRQAGLGLGDGEGPARGITHEGHHHVIGIGGRFLNCETPEKTRHPGIMVLGGLDRVVEVVGPGEGLEGRTLQLVGK